MPITAMTLRETVAGLSRGIIASRDELNTMDAQLGDGDLGITLSHAAQNILGMIDSVPDDIGKALLALSQAVTRSRASSFGTLLATGILAMAKDAMGKEAITVTDLGAMLEDAVEKMASRGKSALGDKTVLDSIHAIAQALRLCTPNVETRAADAAYAAATNAIAFFRGKPCRQGRARMFANKSVGIDDPGMVAIGMMARTLVTIRTNGVEKAV